MVKFSKSRKYVKKRGKSGKVRYHRKNKSFDKIKIKRGKARQDIEALKRIPKGKLPKDWTYIGRRKNHLDYFNWNKKIGVIISRYKPSGTYPKGEFQLEATGVSDRPEGFSYSYGNLRTTNRVGLKFMHDVNAGKYG